MVLLLCSCGGCRCTFAKAVKKAKVIAYDDLGTEAIRKLEVENLPAIVVIDSEGSYLYEDVAKKYRKFKKMLTKGFSTCIIQMLTAVTVSDWRNTQEAEEAPLLRV